MINNNIIMIRREIEVQVKRELDRPIISTVIGPRQVGKTTLLRQLIAGLKERGIPGNRIISLNFDDLELRSRLDENPGELGREVETRLGLPLSALRERVYLFLDEAQKASVIFDEIKLLFDRYRDRLKIFITGSSSLEIRRRMSETLAGRIRYHYLSGITLREAAVHYGLWKGGDGLLALILRGEFSEDAARAIQADLWEARREMEAVYRRLLLYGSLPEVFLEESEEERWFILRDYAATYIEKDIRLLGRVGDLDLFHRLYRSLLLRNGNLLNVSNLASDLGMSRNTIKTYLEVMEQTLVIEQLPPWLKRRSSRLLKSPKLYFFDSGLINHAARRTEYRPPGQEAAWGAVAESAFLTDALSLARNMSIPPEFFFWRDYRGRELDFVIEGKKLYGLEVTAEPRRREKRFINIEAAREQSGIGSFFLLGPHPRLEREVSGTAEIQLIPFWLLF